MKKTWTLLFIFMGAISITFGQTENQPLKKQPLEMRRNFFGGYQFYKGDMRLFRHQISYLMQQTDTEAFKAFRSARYIKSLALFFKLPGAFMIGYPIGVALAGGDPNWNWALIGGGLTVISIPINQQFYKKARKAIDIYNGDIPIGFNEEKFNMEMSMSGNGVGLKFSF